MFHVLCNGVLLIMKLRNNDNLFDNCHKLIKKLLLILCRVTFIAVLQLSQLNLEMYCKNRKYWKNTTSKKRRIGNKSLTKFLA